MMDLGKCTRFVSVHKDSWFDTSMPFEKDDGAYMCGHAAVLVGNSVFLYGGHHDSREVEYIYIYDISRDKWSAIFVGVLAGDLLYGAMQMAFLFEDKMISYMKNCSSLIKVDCLLLTVTRLETYGDPYPRISGLVGAYHETREEGILCNGSHLYIYEARSNSFRKRKPKGTVPARRSRHACCVSIRTFILTGGDIESGIEREETPGLQLYALTLSTMTWARLEPRSGYVPERRFLFTASYVNGRIFVMGGYGASNNLDVFSLEDQRWHGVAPTATAQRDTFELTGAGLMDGTRDHAVVHTEEKLIIFGGFGDYYEVHNPMVIAPVM